MWSADSHVDEASAPESGAPSPPGRRPAGRPRRFARGVEELAAAAAESGPAPTTSPDGTDPGASPSPHALELARQLVAELRADAGARPGSRWPDGGPRVVLDAEIDGVRCTLTRVPAEDGRRHAGLSSRELEIARMIAEGHTTKTVAAVLDISSWTVSTHLRRVFAKLGVASRAAMVAQLIDEGALSLPAEKAPAPRWPHL